jgi:hypothetical protein
MLFNKAYQHNNETEVSQNNMTQQDVTNPNQQVISAAIL